MHGYSKIRVGRSRIGYKGFQKLSSFKSNRRHTLLATFFFFPSQFKAKIVKLKLLCSLKARIMSRRVVSVVILPCLLLTQSAALLGNAHASLLLPGHDVRPHLHLITPSGSHRDHHHSGHEHHHAGHSAGHHHKHKHVEVAESQPVSDKPEQPADHQHGLIFVDAQDVVINGRFEISAGSTLSLDVVAGNDHFCLDRLQSQIQVFANYWHPPPSGLCCPIYLFQLSLLI